MASVGGNITERLLADAGITAGMRVLDIGCGSGDATFILARMVGDNGAVVGVDHDPPSLKLARTKAQQLGLHNLVFIESNVYALPFDENEFDAVFGRRVLMYLPDPLGAICEIARSLRPGGLVIFQEHDRTMSPRSLVPMPLHERIYNWIWRMVEKEGGNTHMGFDLYSVLTEAGLKVECLRAEGMVQTPTAPHPFADILRAVMPRMIAHGVTTAEELDVETLAQRLADECRESGATFVGDLVFGVWARKLGA